MWTVCIIWKAAHGTSACIPCTRRNAKDPVGYKGVQQWEQEKKKKEEGLNTDENQWLLTGSRGWSEGKRYGLCSPCPVQAPFPHLATKQKVLSQEKRTERATGWNKPEHFGNAPASAAPHQTKIPDEYRYCLVDLKIGELSAAHGVLFNWQGSGEGSRP